MNILKELFWVVLSGIVSFSWVRIKCDNNYLNLRIWIFLNCLLLLYVCKIWKNKVLGWDD